MRVTKRKDADRYERITGANGAGKQRPIRGRHRPRRAHLLVVHRRSRQETALLGEDRCAAHAEELRAGRHR